MLVINTILLSEGRDLQSPAATGEVASAQPHGKRSELPFRNRAKILAATRTDSVRTIPVVQVSRPQPASPSPTRHT